MAHPAPVMSAPPSHRRGPAAGFSAGLTPIAARAEAMPGAACALGIDFAIHRQAPGETLRTRETSEAAWVLLAGEAALETDGIAHVARRASLFDEPPTAIHVAAGATLAIRAGTEGCEWAVARTENAAPFPARLFLPADLQPEYRGAGLVQNACLRNVRLIFDRVVRPASQLVIGEVVNYPGRWSSYPPHHHDQPEIYHYRFTDSAGYGHAELGDDVVKVRHGDTVVIPPGRDHAQVSAPGYGMYYLWVIRHLPGNPYTGFTFAEEHRWTLDAARQGWRPSDLPKGLV